MSIRASGFTQITVAGFKSIATEQSIDLGSLTLLAGPNSSGKSSIVQPLLLMKQTLEATFDPGSLLLDGSNAQFTSADQFLSRLRPRGPKRTNFRVALSDGRSRVQFVFTRRPGAHLEIDDMEWSGPAGDGRLTVGMVTAQILEAAGPGLQEHLDDLGRSGAFSDPFGTSLDAPHEPIALEVVRDRFFLRVQANRDGASRAVRVSAEGRIERWVRDTIHVPGWRGTPERNYPVTAVGESFPGRFENYTASVIAKWQAGSESHKIAGLRNDLGALGLARDVEARPVEETRVEVRVGRIANSGSSDGKDMVSSADVGVGHSQVLPVLVALQQAQHGQLVYLEQPEIHLHPRAQVALGRVLVDAAKRGVRLLVETHSSLLLTGVQAAVAEGRLPGRDVRLHWFKRDDIGATSIASASLDDAGAFGDWPSDFDDVALSAFDAYLDAAEQFRRKTG